MTKWESNPRTRVNSQEIIADIVFMVPKVGLEPTCRSIWFWIRQVYQFHHLGILLNKYCYEFYTMSLSAQTVRTICSFPTILFNNLAMRGIYYSLCLQPLRRTPLWLFGMDVIADASGGSGWTWTNNRIKHLIYSQGWYQLHCTDPYMIIKFFLTIIYCIYIIS